MQPKKFAILIGTIAIIVIAIIVGKYLSPGKLIINTNPPGATLEINKKTYTTPATIKLISGTYTIKISKDGYINDERKINVKSRKDIDLNINLVSLRNAETINPTILEKILKLLPYENDHFKINWVDNKTGIEIVPKISWGNDFPPEYYFENNWASYEIDGKEALQWLEDNELGASFRKENNINLIWWGEDWWPKGKTTPSL